MMILLIRSNFWAMVKHAWEFILSSLWTVGPNMTIEISNFKLYGTQSFWQLGGNWPENLNLSCSNMSLRMPLAMLAICSASDRYESLLCNITFIPLKKL